MAVDREKMIAMCNAFCKNTLMETLGIEFIDAGEDFLQATMPVNPRIHQPMGLLHGGASVALAESVGSAASMLSLEPLVSFTKAEAFICGKSKLRMKLER